MIILSIVIVFILWILYEKNPYKKCPPSPLAIPLIGHLHLLGENINNDMDLLFRRYGEVFRFKMGSVEGIVLTGPGELFKKHLLTMIYLLIDFQREGRTDINRGESMTSSNGEYNTYLRSILLQHLTPSKLKKSEESMVEEISKLYECLKVQSKSGEPINLFPFFKNSSTSSTDYNELMTKLKTIIGKLVEDRISGSESPNIIADSYIHEFKAGNISNIGLFLLLPISSLLDLKLLSLVILCLIRVCCNYPEVQEKLYLELTSVENRIPSKISTPYTNAVIRETMRRYTINGFGNSHEAIRDGYFRGYYVKKGTQVFQNIHSSMLSEQYWDDPMEFKPERFIGVDAQKNSNRVKIIFGSGPRNCVGMNLAELEVYLVVTQLIKSFKFTSPNSEFIEESMVYGLAVSPTPFKWLQEVRAIIVFILWILYEKNPYKKCPPSPLAIPLIGHLHLLGENINNDLDRLFRRYGEVFRFKMGSVEGIVLTGPETIQEAFTYNDLFVNRFQKKERTDINRGESMTSSNGEYNTYLRSILLQHLTPSKLKKSEESMVEEISKLYECLKVQSKSGEPINLFPFVKICTLNILLTKLFDKQFPYELDGQAIEILNIIQGNQPILGRPMISEYSSLIKSLVILCLIRVCCNYPEVQEKLYLELTSVENRIPSKISTPYTNAVIRETMRRYPINGFGNSHEAIRDGYFRGYYVKKGIQVFQNIHSSLLSEQYWDDPMEFKPERFIGVDAQKNSNRVKIIYGSGPRNCVGMNLAEVEIYVLVTQLIKSFKFTSPNSEFIEESMVYGLALSPTPFKYIEIGMNRNHCDKDRVGCGYNMWTEILCSKDVVSEMVHSWAFTTSTRVRGSVMTKFPRYRNIFVKD
ncbi:cytochrome P450 family protein [Heterostelium album PN500]|uniref:Cytochrome P450 family protein n=1 Tax=Heterostelium pallidum (strain ATCC 26659 / Pp 5 / PN500) TaxID=670386 RepID=D3BFL4_HETP5|nr:cytochrome P450 family protein [Heterostelium album PN500]EFA79928.1 cytochrome P450 family protein [Heterostelium album PN500]|eukprot:XP_020432048.1 cytochrome P450 family protein [Heterostelium album PN500]